MSKKTLNTKQKPDRYLVFFNPPVEEQGLYYNNNFVSYNVRLDCRERNAASALAMAHVAARTYNGQIYVDYGDGDLKLLK